MKSERQRKSFIEKAKEIIEVGAEGGVSTISEVFLEGVIGAAVPGATNVILNYKQKRMEENLLIFITELQERVSVIEENYLAMTSENRLLIEEFFAGLICDYVIDEQEAEKIRYIANGFVSLTGQETLMEEQTILYLDILKNLRLIDLKILFDKEKKILHDGNFSEYLDVLGIDVDYYRVTREKLLRQGLFKSSYDDEYQRLVKKVNDLTDWTMSVQKGKPNRLASNFASFKPKERENISLSDLGRSFIEFFSETCQTEEFE
ncbi:hypothetical protein [Bacillus alkalisoli]|uniref:hypothetical protein n=1 Tax=Bacillus alkalisoli TaxID=2011008 RepID=UPI000C250D41|nr:hypothetical protein [Bacillus alkalisoli]